MSRRPDLQPTDLRTDDVVQILDGQGRVERVGVVRDIGSGQPGCEGITINCGVGDTRIVPSRRVRKVAGGAVRRGN